MFLGAHFAQSPRWVKAIGAPSAPRKGDQDACCGHRLKDASDSSVLSPALRPLPWVFQALCSPLHRPADTNGTWEGGTWGLKKLRPRDVFCILSPRRGQNLPPQPPEGSSCDMASHSTLGTTAPLSLELTKKHNVYFHSQRPSEQWLPLQSLLRPEGPTTEPASKAPAGFRRYYSRSL